MLKDLRIPFGVLALLLAPPLALGGAAQPPAQINSLTNAFAYVATKDGAELDLVNDVLEPIPDMRLNIRTGGGPGGRSAVLLTFCGRLFDITPLQFFDVMSLSIGAVMDGHLGVPGEVDFDAEFVGNSPLPADAGDMSCFNWAFVGVPPGPHVVGVYYHPHGSGRVRITDRSLTAFVRFQ